MKNTNQGQVEDKEVILIKPYEVSSSSSTKSTFIDDEVNNLLKYIKFICSFTQIRIFWPSPHYQSLKSRGKQNQKFWKKVAIALVKNKYNTEISQNSYPITMYQGGPPYEPYFIAINNRGQVIIGPNKKMVAIYMVEELKILVWFMRTWMLKRGYCYNWCLLDVMRTRVKGNDNIIGYTAIVSASALCNRCHILALSSCCITWLLHILWTILSWFSCIYSVKILLYSLRFTDWHLPLS